MEVETVEMNISEEQRAKSGVIDLPGEVWKDVVGYEGCYAVSNLGRIKSLERLVGFGTNKQKRVVKESIKQIGTFNQNDNGYKTVILSKKSKLKLHYVHRLVAEAFIPRSEGCDVVNHLDCDKTNNRADNLEWTTYKRNSEHAKKHGRYIKIRPVINIETGECFESAKEAAHAYGVVRTSIARCLTHAQFTCRGYHWKYAEQKG